MTKQIVMLSITLLFLGCASISHKSKVSAQAPRLIKAEVKTIWIPNRIEGNRFIEGHFVHVINKQATWGEQ